MNANASFQPYKIMVKDIKRETEKAVLVTFSVTWNHDKNINKDIWVPKSIVNFVEEFGNKYAIIAPWFINQAMEKNSFHGYRMIFNNVVE